MNFKNISKHRLPPAGQDVLRMREQWKRWAKMMVFFLEAPEPRFWLTRDLIVLFIEVKEINSPKKTGCFQGSSIVLTVFFQWIHKSFPKKNEGSQFTSFFWTQPLFGRHWYCWFVISWSLHKNVLSDVLSFFGLRGMGGVDVATKNVEENQSS